MKTLEKILNFFGLTTLRRLRGVEEQLAYFTDNLKRGNSFITLKENDVVEGAVEEHTIFVTNGDNILIKDSVVAGVYGYMGKRNCRVENCSITQTDLFKKLY